MLQFQILGDVAVSVDGEFRPISAKRQRAVVCLLALSANRPVAPNVLIEGLWGSNVPQRPDTALHIIVSRLRTALGPAAARLVSSASGYRLDLASDELDFTLAQSEFIRGRSLLRDGEPERAVAVFAAALQGWSDKHADDLANLPFYESAMLQIRELRASIEETRFEALLAAGRHVEVLAQMQRVIALHPWRERLRFHLMVALYRSGRQVDALREYDEFRRLLLEQLGVEPTKELRDLHIQILDQDSRLQLSRPGITAPIPAWTSTALPFVGRDEEQELILSRVRAVDAGGQRFVLVSGEPGIGKTRLAMEVASTISGAAILVSVTGNDATRSAVVGIAERLAEESSALGDDELRLCLGRRPDELAAIVPALRRRLPDLVDTAVVDDAARAVRGRESVVLWIVSLSHRAPVVLMIDDVPRAGPALFQFLRQLFDREGHKRVVVIATAHRGANRSFTFEDLLARMDARGELDRIELGGLHEESVTRLCLQLRIPDAAGRAGDLWSATAGHPFLLGELLHEAAGDMSVVPGSIRDFVRRRVRALGASVRLSVEAASAFLTAFDVTMLAEVAEVSDAIAATHVDRAIEAGILREAQGRSFTFVHELTRRAVLESVEEARAAMLHRRVAGALERRVANPGLLATHWSRATGDDARTKTFGYATAAGAHALRDVDPEAASKWYELAVSVASDDTDKARATRLLAEACLQAEDESSAHSFRDGIELARR